MSNLDTKTSNFRVLIINNLVVHDTENITCKGKKKTKEKEN